MKIDLPWLVVATTILKYEELKVYGKVTIDHGILWKTLSKFYCIY